MKTEIKKTGENFIIEFTGDLRVFRTLKFTKEELLILRDEIEKTLFDKVE